MTSPASPKTYHVKSFGCQMNVYDSERMGDLLSADGLTAVDTPEAADVVVLNTCHIRERAAEKLYSDIGRLRQPRADGSRPTIVAAGCVAQAEGAEIGRRAPDVDVIVGPLAYHRLPELLKLARTGRAVDIDMPAVPKFDSLPQRRIAQASAFLTVQEGCDKFCTFCVVPYTRGPETSRPAADLIAEAEALVARGVREITLLGQNVNAYNGGLTLAGLIRALAQIDGLDRIRYTTSHPRDMQGTGGDDLIAAHVEVAKLMPYLHLPVQSGSDRIFEALGLADPRGLHDIVVNVQGDLPTVEAATVRAAFQPLADPAVDIGTVCAQITRAEERIDPNVVKVVGSPLSDTQMRALYFTRAAAPHGEGPLWHHIGLYAYRRVFLLEFARWAPTPLEQAESLEQLRVLEHGCRIRAVITPYDSPGVDTPDDLTRVRTLVAARTRENP